LPTTRSPASGRERAGAERAVTLLELIVVMTILAVLFGIGVGAFKRLARPDRLALSRITEAVRGAALFARGEGAPASVTLLPEQNAIASYGLRSVGNWQFEDDAGTGWPLPAVYDPASLVRDGVIGSALRLEGGSLLTLPSPPPAFDSPHGFGVDVYLRPADEPRPMTILERRGLWSLSLSGADTLVVTLQLRVQDRVEQLKHELSGVSLPPDAFTRVTVLYDSRSLSVRVDGVRLGEDLLLGQPLLLASNPRVALTTGTPPTSYSGDLDALRLLSVVAGEPSLLPDEVVLQGVERTLRLDQRGRLDPAFHRTPELITIAFGEPLRLSGVELGLLGTVVTREDLEARP